MNEHVDGWIPELVLGTLDDPTRTSVEGHLESCERCAAEVVAMGETLRAMALSVPPERPDPALRTSLLASIVEQDTGDGGADRFGELTGRLARFFELPLRRVRALVELIDEPAAWSRGPAEGIKLIHLEAGPRFAAADPGFVILEPGATFPHHRHVGGELVLVLQGSFADADGTVLRAGDSQDLASNTSHFFTAQDQGCILAVIIWEGLDFTARDA
jgi:quercetin dioxygenase-like cupin family protein